MVQADCTPRSLVMLTQKTITPSIVQSREKGLFTSDNIRKGTQRRACGRNDAQGRDVHQPAPGRRGTCGTHTSGALRKGCTHSLSMTETSKGTGFWLCF